MMRHLGSPNGPTACGASRLEIGGTVQDILQCSCPKCLWAIVGQLQVQLAQVLKHVQLIEERGRVQIFSGKPPVNQE